MLFLAINQPLADGGPPAPEGIVDHLAWIDHGLATGVIETAGRWGTGGVVLLHATDHAAADDYLAGDPLGAC